MSSGTVEPGTYSEAKGSLARFLPVRPSQARLEVETRGHPPDDGPLAGGIILGLCK